MWRDDKTTPTTPGTTRYNSMNIFGLIDYRVFLILALVPIAILILRLWCAVVERRRRQNRRREGGNQSPDVTEEEINREYFQPPPSYSQVFSSNQGDIPTISAHTVVINKPLPVCEFCQKRCPCLGPHTIQSDGTNTCSDHSPDGTLPGTSGDISIMNSRQSSGNDQSASRSGAVASGQTNPGYIDNEDDGIVITVRNTEDRQTCRCSGCSCYNSSDTMAQTTGSRDDATAGVTNTCVSNVRGTHLQPSTREALERSITATSLPSYEQALDMISSSKA